MTPTKLLASLAVAAMALLGACAGTTDDDAGSDTTDESVGQGFGSQDASADVAVVGFDPKPGAGFVTPVVEITNHSSKPSDYYVEANIEDGSGTVLGYTNGAVNRLQPNAKARLELVFVQAPPTGSTIVVTQVQRTEAQ